MLGPRRVQPLPRALLHPLQVPLLRLPLLPSPHPRSNRDFS
jgi:hypothetical protein